MELISRQAVLNALKEHRSLFCNNTPETFSKLSYAEKSRVDELDTAIATIINLPSAENKGEWVHILDSYYEDGTERESHWECSKCGSSRSGWGEFKFCPDCGADMRGE